MHLLTIDFESAYDKKYSLSHLTTEEYIRSPEFEVIGVSVKVDDGAPEWASGTTEQLKNWLQGFDFEHNAALAHNAMFDMAILNWVFDIRPKFIFDTLCMGRGLHGVDVGGSLKALAERYEVGVKGTEVVAAMGKRRKDFSHEELSRYGDYCCNDTELTYRLYEKMVPRFPKKELHLIDLTIRMFTEPVLHLDTDLLKQHLTEIQANKAKLMATVEADKDQIMSNPKFALLLSGLGVMPPTKISATTGKETLALAKTDEEFLALLDHPDERVQTLVAARLGNKSTIEETRTERFIGIASRGLLPVPLKYAAAFTKRWGGDDKINMQNLASRGAEAGKLKQAILAPPGHVIIDCDSKQIEVRVLAWLSGQTDLLEAMARGEDVYKQLASKIFGVPEDEVTKGQRFVAKTIELGCGFGTGALKLQATLKLAGVHVTLDEAREYIKTYRDARHRNVALWRQGQAMLIAMSRGEPCEIGRPGVLKVHSHEFAIELPNGMQMQYTGLDYTQGEQGLEFSYKTRIGRTKIFGGKIAENITSAVARCIVAEQMLRISRRYKVVLMVHDAVASIAREEEAEEARAFVEEQMRWVPPWAEGLPIDCESGMGKSLGDC